MNLTLDSSVIVAALRRQEERHQECKTILELIKEGKHTAFESVIVPVEVAASVRRRTGSERLANQVWKNLIKLSSLILVDLTRSRMESAARIAEKTGLRGMDAIIVQVAEESEAILVTLDIEMANKSNKIVLLKEVGELLEAI